MARYLLAVDQGTSSSRALLFEPNGSLVAVAQQEFDSDFPRPGWVEHDPEVLWRTTTAVSRGVLAEAGISARDVIAIGITNQRETTLLWDRKTGGAVYSAIVWQDRRTATLCDRMRADGMDEVVTERTGLLIDPYFSGTKLAWLLEQPGVRRRAEAGDLAFGTVDSFLLWRMTGGAEHRIDATNASRTQLCNIHSGDWDEELLRYFDIPAVVLPEIVDSVGQLGVTQTSWLGAPVPICGIAGDQQAALVGQACFRPGQAKSTYGTGCFAMINTGATVPRSTNRLLTTIAYRLNGESIYALEGSIFVAGAAVKWLRDRLGVLDDAAASEQAAWRCGGDSGGVFVVPAFTGLGAPWWDPRARGMICGLGLDSSRDQIVTATLEAMSFQTADLLGAMAGDGAVVDELRIDGGMVVNDWLCQNLADITGVAVARPRVTETTAWGAAMLAGIGAGVFSSLEQAARVWQAERSFAPVIEPALRADRLAGWRRAVQRARSVDGDSI